MAKLAAARKRIGSFHETPMLVHAADGTEPTVQCSVVPQVARYLFWSVDGGLHPGEMDLTMLIQCASRRTVPLLRLPRVVLTYMPYVHAYMHMHMHMLHVSEDVPDVLQ